MASRSKNTSSDFADKWQPDTDFAGTGLGAELEGQIQQLRFHTVNAKDRVERYIAIVMEVRLAFSVEVDKYGAEKSFDPHKDTARKLSFDDLWARFAPPAGLLSRTESDQLHPVKQGVFEFWALAATDARHLTVGDEIHMKTIKDSFLVKSFFHTKMGSFQHLDGGATMHEMSQKANSFTVGEALPQDEAEGCESDEWSD